MAMAGIIIELAACLVLIGVVSGSCKAGRSGANCTLQCHCSVEAECETGLCPSGCEPGLPSLGQQWSGPACQIGNIALHKPTNQTRTYLAQTSDQAVDGQLGNPESSIQLQNCANQNAAYEDSVTGNVVYLQASFWIDLQGTFRVFNVTVHNAFVDDSALSDLGNFSVSVQTESGQTVPCGIYSKTAASLEAVSIQCDAVGRYVHLQKFGGALVHQMHICEIVVIGHQYYDCTSCPSGVTCSEYTGCEKCPAGKLPPECVLDCTPGTDPSCSEACVHCKENTQCNVQDGSCPQGCQMWWAGRRCNTEIVLPDRTTERLSSGTQSFTSLEVKWEPIQKLSPEATSYYSYLVTYRYFKDATDTNGPIVQHTDEDILSAVITQLEPGTVYDIKVWPFREMTGQVDYGEPYERLMLETLDLDEEDESSANMDFNEGNPESSASLSWTLFGVACGIIFILLAVIVFLVLKYVRKPFSLKQTPKKPDFSAAFYANSDHHVTVMDQPNSAHTIYDDILHDSADEPRPSTSSHYEPVHRQNTVYQNDISPYEHIRK